MIVNTKMEKIFTIFVGQLGWVWSMMGGMAGPDVYTASLFGLADACIEAGCFPGLEDKRYILLLRFTEGPRCEIRRAHVNCVLPLPCRVWCCKGAKRFLLGDSHVLPLDLADGVRPPFLG